MIESGAGPAKGIRRGIGTMTTFDHEMLREIYQQPQALRHTLGLYLDSNALKPQIAALLAGWSIPEGEILIAASGSSRHSGLAAEILLEDLCGLAVDVEYASEFSCRGGNAKADHRHPSFLVLSQSGETSDTLAALREARRRGQKTLAITNATDSSMAREADVSMPLAAGVERAIPATKSFTCQLAVLYLLALYEGVRLGHIDAESLALHIRELLALPGAIEAQLDGWRDQMHALATKYKFANTFLYLGRGIHYAIAREGALKLKEASYVHAEGYPTGELKHGPNALVSDTVPLVVLATVDRTSSPPSSATKRPFNCCATCRLKARASSPSPTPATTKSPPWSPIASSSTPPPSTCCPSPKSSRCNCFRTSWRWPTALT